LWSRACVCLSAAACPHNCTDPDVTWGSGKGCPLVVHYWADLQSVHGLRCYGNTVEIRQAHRTPHACRPRTVRMPAKTPLAGDNMDAPAACAVPFRPHCGGVLTRMRNVCEYMLVLALCLVYDVTLPPERLVYNWTIYYFKSRETKFAQNTVRSFAVLHAEKLACLVKERKDRSDKLLRRVVCV